MPTEVNDIPTATSGTSAEPVVTLTERELVVEYPSFREFISRSVSTLSKEGMFVATSSPRAAGSQLSFVLKIVDGFQLMQGEAEVVAVRQAEGHAPEGMSIRFHKLDEPGLRLLEKVVDSHSRQGEPLFVLEQPTPKVTPEAAPAVEPPAADRAEPAIPELAEIEASVRQTVRPPEPQAVRPAEPQSAPSADESFVDMEGAVPSTLITPPDDVTPLPQSPPPPDQSFMNVEDDSPPTLVKPPEDMAAPPPAEPLIPEPEFSVQDLPPVEAQPPLPEPPAVELPEIGGIDAAPVDSEDVRWEEPIAISPPSASGLDSTATTPSAPETRFTDELSDVPVPDELVVASGALKWPDETGAVDQSELEMPDLEAPLTTARRKGRPRTGLFLLLVVAILVGAAGYGYYTGLLQPYVDALTTTIASFIEGESEVDVAAPDESTTPPEEAAAEGTQAEAVTPSPRAVDTRPLAPSVGGTQGAAPVVSKLTRIERISWEELGGETLLMLWADDQVVGGQVERSRLESGGARVIIKIYGVTRPLDEGTLEVGTSHINRIRTGLHKEPRGSVLHVVADLASPDVYVREMEPQGSRLQVYFANR